ncbi:MAG: insulinase family protein [Deltaproteobacteria bacterium]|nr:insulinase family protein [Deltaproteobacteria bacterium]
MVVSLVSPANLFARADLAYTLDNGLRVILSPQPGNPVISARILVKVGSSSENGQAEYGLAHLMEHMAFKGTAKRKVGEISSLIERNGGLTNAATSYDYTVYYISLPSEKLELSLDLLSDMVFFPTYDPQEYAKEKEVVIEEINRSEDNPYTVMAEKFFSDAFPGDHPYTHRILGSIDTVRNASRDTAFAFHTKYYRPDNVFLVVTGGFDTRDASVLVDKYFKDLKNPSEPLNMDLSDRPAPKGPTVRIMHNKDATQPQVLLGFRCGPASSSEAPIQELLSAVLTMGQSSRLDENVRYKEGLVTSVASSAMNLRRSGLFIIRLVTEADKVKGALESVFSQLNNLSSTPPAQDELARSVAIITKSFVEQQETPWSLGHLIESFELYSGNYRLKDSYINEWSKIGSLDLVYLAQDIFTKENLTLTLMLPEGEDSITEADLLAAIDKLKLPTSEEKTQAIKPAFEVYSLSNGIKVYAMKDPSIPLVEVRLGVLGGRLAESDNLAGLSSLTAEVWPAASTTRKATEMSRAIESLGVTISGYSGRNSLGLDGTFMKSNWREGLALFTELLTSPAFNDEDFTSKKAEQLAYLLSLEEDLQTRVYKILRHKLYGKHPYSIDANGEIPTVEPIKREDLVNLYQELIRPDNIYITVAGDVEPNEFIEALEDELKDWSPQGKDLKVTLPAAPVAVKGPLFTSESLDRQQTHLALAFLGPGLDSEDQAPMDVLSSALSGMGGILFQDLREEKSLAYTVSGSYGAFPNIGSFTFYIGTSPEKTGESLSGMLQIIENLKAKALSGEEVEGAKTYLLGVNKMRHQTLASRGMETLVDVLYNLGIDYYDNYQTKIAAVTPADLQRVAKKYLNLDSAVLAVVGTDDSVKTAESLLK